MSSDYDVLLHPDDAQPVLDAIDDKSERIIRDHLGALGDDPYPRPGAGKGDRESIEFDGIDGYRMHISRTWTAFYTIEENSQQVLIHEITDIDDAHKRYGN